MENTSAKKKQIKGLWEKFCEFDDRMSQPAFEITWAQYPAVQQDDSQTRRLRTEIQDLRHELQNKNEQDRLLIADSSAMQEDENHELWQAVGMLKQENKQLRKFAKLLIEKMPKEKRKAVPKDLLMLLS